LRLRCDVAKIGRLRASRRSPPVCAPFNMAHRGAGEPAKSQPLAGSFLLRREAGRERRLDRTVLKSYRLPGLGAVGENTPPNSSYGGGPFSRLGRRSRSHKSSMAVLCQRPSCLCPSKGRRSPSRDELAPDTLMGFPLFDDDGLRPTKRDRAPQHARAKSSTSSALRSRSAPYRALETVSECFPARRLRGSSRSAATPNPAL